MNAPSDASRRSPDATWAAPDTAPGPGSGLAWLSRAPARAAPPDPVLPDGEPPVGVIGAGSTVSGATVSGATIGGSTMGSGSAQGAALPGLAGGLPAGQVLTWLPDGRWVSADAEDDVVLSEPTPAPVDPGAGARRWGQRRIGLARAGARLARWPRRVLVGLLLLAAVLLAARPRPVAVTAAPAPPTTDVVVAARDLAAGTVLAAPDLRTVSLPVPVVPAGATGRPAGLVGRMAAGAIRRGETVTDTRVVGPGLTAGLGPGESAAVPVRLADPDSAALVRPGDRVDVLGTPVTPEGGQPPGGDAVDVATGVRVLAVLGGRDAADGVVLVVAATQPTARRLVGAAARHRLTVSVRPP
ncbi:MAG TPA: Flp pilus assembly protein CpaB [Mycobacteriales bacterium]